jgi:hypothetical protein
MVAWFRRGLASCTERDRRLAEAGITLVTEIRCARPPGRRHITLYATDADALNRGDDRPLSPGGQETDAGG